MVRWWVLVHCVQVIRRCVNAVTRYLTSSFGGGAVGGGGGRWGPTSQYDWPIAPKKRTMEAPQSRRFCFNVFRSSTSAHLYIGERWTTFAKAYGINVRCLYGEHVEDNTLWTWGTYWESSRNIERTPWEHIGKQGKMEKKISPPPKFGNKSKAPWAFPLARWNSSSQNSLSQLFIWANTPSKEHPSYIGEKWRILGKTYGFEIWCYWEHP